MVTARRGLSFSEGSILQTLLSFARPDVSWTATPVHELPSWRGVKVLGIDVETRDDDLGSLGPGFYRPGSYIAGVGICLDGGPRYYLPVRHGGGGNLDPDIVFEYLSDQSREFDGYVDGANLQYDLPWLATEGVLFPRAVRFRDTLTADAVLYELHPSYSLLAVGDRWGVDSKDEDVLRDACEAYGFKGNYKKNLWRLPASMVAHYCMNDAWAPTQTLPKQLAMIELASKGKPENHCLRNIWNLECRVLPALIAMNRRGVRIDLSHLSYMERWTSEKEREYLAQIKDQTGFEIGFGNMQKPRIISAALERVGIRCPKTATGKVSVTKDWLDTQEHPVAQLIIKARSFSTLRTTFCGQIRRMAVRGRVHCTFNQMKRDKNDGSGGSSGTITGRLSAEKPSLQNQPIRSEEIGPLWRKIYIPEYGENWYCVDIKQQEPTLTLHFAALKRFTGAVQAAEMLRDDPSIDSHTMMSNLTSLPRWQAKIVFLALCYGMGSGKMAKKLNLPTTVKVIRGRRYVVGGDEVQAILKQFHERVPYIRELDSAVRDVANDRGFIRTILGRELHFPTDEAGNPDFLHKALNKLIQGSAADQMKEGMAQAHEAGFEIRLQVHDELDFSTDNDDEAMECARIVKNAVPLSTTVVRVDVEDGDSWGNLTRKRVA